MVQVRGLASNRNHSAQGWRGGCAQPDMVPLTGQTSNQLLDTPAEWSKELEAHPEVSEPIL
jgi:hypothetical protein